MATSSESLNESCNCRETDHGCSELPGIAVYLGGTTTESAVEHRFRAVKVQAEACREIVTRGGDPSLCEISAVKTTKDMNNGKTSRLLRPALVACRRLCHHQGASQPAKGLRYVLNAHRDGRSSSSQTQMLT